MSYDWKVPTDSIEPLLDMVIKYVPEASRNPGAFQMLITSLDYSSYTGRMAIGRVHRGIIHENMPV
jgi:GTP-binding protein